MKNITHHHRRHRTPLFLLLLAMCTAFWTGAATAAVTVIVDDANVQASKGVRGFWMDEPGRWDATNNGNAYLGRHHKADENDPKKVRWYPVLGAGNAGDYRVYAWWVKSNSNEYVSYRVQNDAGTGSVVGINQQNPGNGWVLLGTWRFNGTNNEYVQMTGNKNCSADAIKFEPVVTNNPPVAHAEAITVTEGGTATVLNSGAASVLANDTDADSNPLTALLVAGPANGTLTLNANGTFSYTHNGFESTTDSFRYKANDGTSDSNTVTVTITITPVNDPPTANDDTYTVEATSSNTLDVLANDTDPDLADTITIVSVAITSGGGSVVNNGNSLTFDAPVAVGAVILTYTIEDLDGVQSTATVTITISPVNSPPTAVDDGLTVNEDTFDNALDVQANDFDVDVGDTFTINNVDSTGTLGTVTFTPGNVTYTPTPGFVGVTTFTYTLKDNHGHISAPATATITVANVNDAPVAAAELILAVEGQSTNLLVGGETSVLANDTDVDGDPLSAFLVTSVSHGTLVLNADGTFLYTHDGSAALADSFSYQASDGSLTSAVVTINITIIPSGHTLSGMSMDAYTSMPLNLTTSAIPLVLLAASKDHQLFFKAYSDYADLDNDQIIDITYKSTINYYGYFDSAKCYDYDIADKRFEPKSESDADHYCTTAGGGEWSGNFLNWISMSRIDTIRKILFGGHRRVDTTTDTVLERAYLPHDAHSWAKYYNGNDYDKMTPFTVTANGITFCNTTDVDGNLVSQNDTVMTDMPPLIKVAQGNYALWAANERWQCTWNSDAPYDNHAANNGNNSALTGLTAQPTNPKYDTSINNTQYIARVQVCVDGLIGRERCKQYPDGNYKPIGLLQVYGDDDQIKFGMIAGTYQKHVSGGALISNIGKLRYDAVDNPEGEIDPDNGTFVQVAQIAGGPKTNNQAMGLINAWSLFRIIGYYHGDGTYNAATSDNCPWGLSDFADVSGSNTCRNWGNPFSEIYFQALRYFSDAGITGTYRSNASTGITGLPTPQNWTNPNPLNDDNYCSSLNVVAFNSSIASYDGDELDANNPGVQEIWDVSVLPGDDTSSAMTDVVGDGEGITNNPYFVGRTADDTNQLCTPKTIPSLGAADGLCPESPRLSGTYRIAGLAYYAHTEDIRADYLAPARRLPGIQKVDTYAVSSNASSPKISIPHPLTKTTAAFILPACRNTSLDPDGNCALVDFQIISQVIDNGSGTGSGKFLVNWEDSEQGGDYDQDMWGILSYEIDGYTNTLKVTTKVQAQSTGNAMGFGYVLSGTANDGFHVHSGISGFNYNETADTGSPDCSDGDGCKCTSNNGHGTCTVDAASTKTYSLGLSPADELHDPLWYAAKWGGFLDANGNNIPDMQSEWDALDAKGDPNPDNVPDNYFFAHNPQQLEDSLNRVFLAILNRASSGTAAAVVSNNVRGEGALYQAFYEPRKQDSSGNVATWIGTIHSFWIDKYGLMREDDGDAILGNYDDDPVIETYYDTTLQRTRVKRWTSTDPDTFTKDTSNTVELGDIKPLWNARKQLNFPTLSDADIANQRIYADNAVYGRHIRTWYDYDMDGLVDSGEYANFDSATISSINYAYYDRKSQAEVQDLVNYIRGVEKTGLRNRTVDYDGDGVSETMRLGDIVNSTPTVVTGPAEGFNLLYRDLSYASFLEKYQDRRNMLYVGANDGMLHAFNAGFFKPETMEFSVNGTKVDGITPATPHPLGSEMWAYVPMNLQPHLQWLQDPGYTHVYYMDLKPRILDAKIFSPGVDPVTLIDHPEGWGTIMVAGMRFGSGKITIDTGANGFLPAPNNTDDLTRSSAYVIMDITDPELEPSLLAEIQLPDQSLTSVYPAAMTFKDKKPYYCPDSGGSYYSSDTDCDSSCTLACTTNASDNKWYLIFGSGPEIISTGNTLSSAKLYILDLAELKTPGSITAMPPGCTLEPGIGTIKMISCDTAEATQFIGTPITVDRDLDYKADELYFGTVGNALSSSGSMFTMLLDDTGNPADWSFPNKLLQTDQPVSAAATVGIDNSNALLANRWAFFGTGRLLVNADKTSTETQSLYGVKEEKTVTCSTTGAEYYEYDDCDTNCVGACTTVAPTPLTTNLLMDMTNVEVQTNGDLIWTPTGETGQAVLDHLVVTTAHDSNETYFDTLERDLLANWAGWKLDLVPIHGTAGIDPATRMLSQQSLLGGILFSAVYQPSVDTCTSEGFSRLYGQYFITGSGLPDSTILGTANYNSGGVNYTYAPRYIDLGIGIATAPSIHTGSGTGDKGVNIFTQLSTGTIIRSPAQTKYSVRSGVTSWKER